MFTISPALYHHLRLAGIMTANPKVVPTAQPVPFVSFEEASELAYFGAEILHPIR